MLTITEAANRRLAEILTGPNAPSDASLAVRISQHGGELGVTFDEAMPTDAIFEYKGEVVLLIDAELAESISRKTLDVTTMDYGPQLTLR